MCRSLEAMPDSIEVSSEEIDFLLWVLGYIYAARGSDVAYVEKHHWPLLKKLIDLKEKRSNSPPRLHVTTTHTFAILEISSASYSEVRRRLEQADYQHTFISVNEVTVRSLTCMASRCEPSTTLLSPPTWNRAVCQHKVA